jgi:antitoxin component YwqK of YwqJK toxin-antitoxin module
MLANTKQAENEPAFRTAFPAAFRNLCMNSKIIITLLSLILACSMCLSGCAGAQSNGGGDKKTGVSFTLSCSGGGPILRKLDNESGLALEEGPVQLPAGTDCGSAADMPETQIRKFARHGAWTFYRKGTATPIRKGNYRQGEREGLWEGFDDKGRLDRTISYQNGVKQGPETFFFAGTREWRERGENVADKREGFWETRHTRDGSCITKGVYQADQKNGAWAECSQDPKTRQWYHSFAGGYLDGLRHGPARVFDEKGKLIAEGNYRADTGDDCRKNPPGGRAENCGKRDGAWKIYFPDGKLAMTGSYDPTSGNRSGVWTEYYRSGEKMAEGPRQHTRLGHWTFYDKRGALLFEAKFDGNDFNPRYAVLYENGRKASEGELSIGLVKYDVDKDTVKMSTMVQNGQWILYDPASGRKIGAGEMIAGKKNGKWQEFSGGKTQTVCYMLGRPRTCD